MKKVLSLILALAMLMGCSLMVFAAEPCEECNEGTLRPRFQPAPGNHSMECPACSAANQDVTVYFDYYYCDNCGDFAYRIFEYSVVDCVACRQKVKCFVNPIN